MKEIWKDIPDYEGLYQASNLGKIKSLINNKILKPIIDNKKYRYVFLYNHGKSKKYRVHRIILITFISNCPEGMECRHLDGNPENNKLENLKWGTSKENSKDRKIHGNWSNGNRQGSRNPMSKLNEIQVKIIKYLLKTNILKQKEIAKVFGVKDTIISQIKHNKRWRSICPQT